MLSTIDENLRFSRPQSLSHPRNSMSFPAKYGLLLVLLANEAELKQRVVYQTIVYLSRALRSRRMASLSNSSPSKTICVTGFRRLRVDLLSMQYRL